MAACLAIRAAYWIALSGASLLKGRKRKKLRWSSLC